MGGVLGGNEQGKSFIDMAIEVTAGFGSILESGPFDQGDDQIMNSGQDTACCTDGHASGIFMKRNIATVMQTSLYQPMTSSDAKELGG
jgi:hypothetical protein